MIKVKLFKDALHLRSTCDSQTLLVTVKQRYGTHALTMISRRVERGESVDVASMLDMTRQQLAQLG